jgi:hypothetical protein
MSVSSDRMIELLVADRLNAALQALVRQTHPRLTNGDVIAGCAEFLTQVCVKAFAAERAQGFAHDVAEMVEEMDELAGEVAAEVLQRLQRCWTP